MLSAQTFVAGAQAAIKAATDLREAAEHEETEDEEQKDPEKVELIYGSKKYLETRLTMLGPRKPPAVPQHPAPPAAPPHTREIPHEVTKAIRKQSAFERAMNSTVGRMVTFGLTLVSFTLNAIGVVDVQERVRRMNGDHYPILFATIGSVIIMYAFLPMISEKAGMHPRSTGWKPYMVLYRCSYLISIPALVCLAFGYGQQSAFGSREGTVGGVRVAQLSPRSGKYFEASDGFVALNLTKGISQTIQRTAHAGDFARSSRYRDAELLINREPFTGLQPPTVPPGVQKTHVMAPIFTNWAPCITRYSISSSCLAKNLVVAWAYATAPTMCSQLNIMSCRVLEPQLDPMYKCSTGANKGREALGPVTGLCGRVVLPPNDDVIDELGALLTAQGWPASAMPNSSLPWIDVTPDDCIGNPDDCVSQWNLMGAIGAGLSGLVFLCVILPACVDYRIDSQIREVRAHREAQELRNNPLAL